MQIINARLRHRSELFSLHKHQITNALKRLS